MKDRRITIWLVLGAILLVVLNLPAPLARQLKGALREGIAPLQGLITGFSEDVSESVKAVRGLNELALKNQEMTGELVRLRDQVNYLKALERENLALRAQLGFARRSTQVLIPSEVIARDISGWWQTIRLNKGVSDGVAAQRAVVTSDGVIGKTIDVSLRTCDVLLLSDPSCKVSATVSRTHSFGVVSGQGVDYDGQVILQMDFINKNTNVRPGDQVVTSGLGGVFPKGLRIGYVEKVVRDRIGLYQRAEVIPAAGFGALTYAFIVAEDEDPVDSLLRKKKLLGGAQP